MNEDKQEAIKLAIGKGGYADAIVEEVYRTNDIKLDISTLEHMPHPDGRYLFSFVEYGREQSVWRIPVLDPLFWQALGKALGWEKMNEIVEHLNRDEEWLLRLLNPSQGYRENAPRVEWE